MTHKTPHQTKNTHSDADPNDGEDDGDAELTRPGFRATVSTNKHKNNTDYGSNNNSNNNISDSERDETTTKKTRTMPTRQGGGSGSRSQTAPSGKKKAVSKSMRVSEAYRKEKDDDGGNGNDGGDSVVSSVVRCTNPNYIQSKPVRLQSANTRKNIEEAARIDRVWCCGGVML